MNEILSDLAALANAIHKQIAQAASALNTPAILGFTTILTEVDRLSSKYHLCTPKGTDADCTSPPVQSQPILNHAELAPKERGRQIRADWLRRNGAGLARVRETLYRNSRGEIVGIAVATQKADAQGAQASWWLGLPRGKFESAVLLCATKIGGVFAVCLPKPFLDDQKDNLSQSVQGGNVQFTVHARGGNVCLQVPRVGRLDVSAFVNKMAPLL